MTDSTPTTATDSAQPDAGPRPKRRGWLRISLRGLMLLVTAVCVLLGLVIVPAERQKKLVEALQPDKGQCSYQRLESRWFSADKEHEPFRTLRRWLGRDYLDRIDRVHLRRDSADILKEHFLVFSHVDAVAILDAKAVSETLDLLRQLPKLKEVELYGRRFEDADLAWIPADSQLENINLQGSWVTDNAVAIVARCSELRTLGLADTAITGEGIDWSLVSELTELDLSENHFSEAALARLWPLHELTTLDLSENRLGDDALVRLTPLQNIETLNLSKTLVTDAGLRALGQLPSLQSLDLSGTKVKHPNLAYCVAPDFSLDLSETRIDNDSLIALAKMKNLRFLALRQTEIDDRAIENLVANGSQVMDLDLTYTDVTDAGLEWLAKLKSLKRVVISAAYITPAELAKFQQLRPDVIVEQAQQPKIWF